MFTDGQLGIGLSNPNKVLEMKTRTDQAEIGFRGNADVEIEASSNISIMSQSNQIRFGTNSQKNNIVLKNGKVGINVVTPNETLSVNGDTSIQGNLSMVGDAVVTGNLKLTKDLNINQKINFTNPTQDVFIRSKDNGHIESNAKRWWFNGGDIVSVNILKVATLAPNVGQYLKFEAPLTLDGEINGVKTIGEFVVKNNRISVGGELNPYMRFQVKGEQNTDFTYDTFGIADNARDLVFESDEVNKFIATDSNGSFAFYTGAMSTSNAAVLEISADQNLNLAAYNSSKVGIGIGQNVPEAYLHVGKDSLFRGVIRTSKNIEVDQTAAIVFSNNRISDGNVVGNWDFNNGKLENILSVNSDTITTNLISANDVSANAILSETFESDYVTVNQTMVVKNLDAIGRVTLNKLVVTQGADFAGVITANSFIGNGTRLEDLNATKITSGYLKRERMKLTNLNSIPVVGTDYLESKDLYWKNNGLEIGVADNQVNINAEGIRIDLDDNDEMTISPKTQYSSSNKQNLTIGSKKTGSTVLGQTELDSPTTLTGTIEDYSWNQINLRAKDKIIFEDSAKVGIGNFNPSHALDVSGNIRFSGELRRDNNIIIPTHGTSHYGHLLMVSTPNFVFVSTANWNAAYATGNLITNTKLGEWNAAYATGNLITNTKLGEWNAAYATGNLITNTKLGEWDAAYVTANKITDTQLTYINKWKSIYDRSLNTSSKEDTFNGVINDWATIKGYATTFNNNYPVSGGDIITTTRSEYLNWNTAFDRQSAMVNKSSSTKEYIPKWTDENKWIDSPIYISNSGNRINFDKDGTYREVHFGSKVIAQFDEKDNGTTTTINWKDGNKQKVSANGGITFGTHPDGSFNLILIVKHTGTGPVSISATGKTVKWANGYKRFTNSTGAIDIVACYYSFSESTYFCSLAGDFKN